MTDVVAAAVKAKMVLLTVNVGQSHSQAGAPPQRGLPARCQPCPESAGRQRLRAPEYAGAKCTERDSQTKCDKRGLASCAIQGLSLARLPGQPPCGRLAGLQSAGRGRSQAGAPPQWGLPLTCQPCPECEKVTLSRLRNPIGTTLTRSQGPACGDTPLLVS